MKKFINDSDRMGRKASRRKTCFFCVSELRCIYKRADIILWLACFDCLFNDMFWFALGFYGQDPCKTYMSLKWLKSGIRCFR